MFLYWWNPLFKKNRSWNKCWARHSQSIYLNPIPSKSVVIFPRLYLNLRISLISLILSTKPLSCFKILPEVLLIAAISYPLISSPKSYLQFWRGTDKISSSTEWNVKYGLRHVKSGGRRGGLQQGKKKMKRNLNVGKNAVYLGGLTRRRQVINPLIAELNPICHLLALFGAHHILHVSR